jgi:hypothetical protein
MTFVRPDHCSERFAGVPSYDDCGPCSTIMGARAHRGQAAPPCSQGEANAIRLAGGGNLSDPFTWSDQLQKALDVRYGIKSAHVQGASTVWSLLGPGKGAVVAGKLSNFPSGHRLRRHQPTYSGGHFVYVQRENTEAKIWWMDPLARTVTKTRDGKTIVYRGEWVTRAELATFQKLAIADAGVIFSIAAAPVVQEVEPMGRFESLRYRMASGAQLYEHPLVSAANQIGTTNADHEVASVMVPYDDAGQPMNGWKGIRWVTGYGDGVTAEKVVYVAASSLTRV